MNDSRHLTEAERQGLADGSLAGEASREAAAHAAACDSCAADVAHLSLIMTRLRESLPVGSAGDIGELWPEIQARIDSRKVVRLPGAGDAEPPGRRAPRLRAANLAAGVAAALLLVVVGTVVRIRHDSAAGDSTADGAPLMVAVAESTQVYEHESETLLADLELRRAMLRPQTASSIDHDLHIIDQAIAELQDAIAHDPNNTALRRLLASSYRQKVELLERVGNAG